MRRLLTLIHARNLEFVRDRSSLGWNLVMPFFLIFGLALAFSGDGKPLFKVAVYQPSQSLNAQYHPFLGLAHVEFYGVTEWQKTLDKVARHQVDMLLNLNPPQTPSDPPLGYWINLQSPNGYVIEKLLHSTDSQLQKHDTENQPISYVDWVIPGVLGMNMMFSAMFGVGFVIVRYRKSGYLKRLNATPLRPVEFLLAQLVSRLVIVVITSALVFLAIQWTLGFAMHGQYVDLLVVAILGSSALVALSLLTTARVASEELAGGLLNLVTWPMMLLSGVWFSLEGSSPWLQSFAQIFPLTPLLEAVRAITIDGATLADLTTPMATLALMTLVFVALGASLFKWSDE